MLDTGLREDVGFPQHVGETPADSGGVNIGPLAGILFVLTAVAAATGNVPWTIAMGCGLISVTVDRIWRERGDDPEPVSPENEEDFLRWHQSRRWPAADEMPVEQRERILVDFRRWQADQNTPGKPVADTMLIDERGRVVVERV